MRVFVMIKSCGLLENLSHGTMDNPGPSELQSLLRTLALSHRDVETVVRVCGNAPF